MKLTVENWQTRATQKWFAIWRIAGN